MEYLGYKWKYTGRNIPEGSKIEIHYLHKKWMDLVYWNDVKKAWMYISTLPTNIIDDVKEELI